MILVILGFLWRYYQFSFLKTSLKPAGLNARAYLVIKTFHRQPSGVHAWGPTLAAKPFLVTTFSILDAADWRAPALTKLRTIEFLNKCQMKLIPHPPYSLNPVTSYSLLDEDPSERLQLCWYRHSPISFNQYVEGDCQESDTAKVPYSLQTWGEVYYKLRKQLWRGEYWNVTRVSIFHIQWLALKLIDGHSNKYLEWAS